MRSPLISIIAAFLLAQGQLSSLADPAADVSARADALELYHQAWQLVEDNFFDPTFNKQSWSRWHHKYDRVIKDNEDAHKAIETMLASLGDRYTRFLNQSAFADEKEQIAARLCGIGIQMGLDKTSRLIVIAPIEGTPAARAGLMPLDEIEAIDNKPTRGLSVEQASKMIRGPVDTQVVLSLIRNKEKLTVPMLRAEIPIKSVQTVKMLTKEVGYIRLSTFMSQDASAELRDALDRLSPARGIVLDLRDNPGGLLNNAIQICSMFLDGGVIVSTIDRGGNMASARATGRPISEQPLVVLINHGSASASEITSGALHDTGRVELVGEKSFGKGLVQNINMLEDGSGINITIARYVTPHNVDIHKKGIMPDYEVALTTADYRQGKGPWWLDGKQSPEELKDAQLKKAVEVMALKLERAQHKYELKLNFPPTIFGPPDLSVK